MRSEVEFQRVLGLIIVGHNNCEISRLTGIPLTTVRRWRNSPQRPGKRATDCPICGGSLLEDASYAYLLGMYLGDGYLVTCRKGVFRLEIGLDRRYPRIIAQCAAAIREVHPLGRANIQPYNTWVQVYSYWKHWPCVFPQHGPGVKHLRKIELTDWQQEIVAEHPNSLLRGLIHSDGCRSINRVKGKNYPRYYFSNYSQDIRDIFCRACDQCGISWRQMNWRTISIARKRDVDRLDLLIGPKS